MAALDISVERDLDANVTVLRPTGPLDLATAVTMRSALMKAIAECPLAVIVDMSACRPASAVALTVFASSARASRSLPAVAMLLCGERHEPRDGSRAVTQGGVPWHLTRAGALDAVEATRARQRRVRLAGRDSLRFPSLAREAVADACEHWGFPELETSAVLITSELVTNAVRHAGGEVGFEAMVRGDFLHLRVRDGSPLPPLVRPSSSEPGDDTPDRGRGLPIVAHYSTAWGWVRGADGASKVVWATVRVRSARRSI